MLNRTREFRLPGFSEKIKSVNNLKQLFMREIYLLLTAFLLSIAINAQTPEELIGWDVTGQGMNAGQGEGAWGEENLAPTTLSDKLEATGLTRLPKYSVNVANNNSVFNAWGAAYTTSTLPLEPDEEGGFTFTVTPKSGNKLALSSLDLFYRRASYGPAQGLFQYKINDGAFTDIETLEFLPTTGGGFVLPQVDLSSVAELQEVTSDETITFRLLLFGKDPNGAGSSVNFYILNNPDVNAVSDFYLSGTVIEVEEEEDGCLDAPYGAYPSNIVYPSCYGVPTVATPYGSTSDYSMISVTEGVTYTFTSSYSTDFITIGNEDGTEVLTSGTGSVTWTAPADIIVRFYTHADADCGTDSNFDHVRTVDCGGEPVTFEDPDFDCFQGDGSWI